MANPNPENLNVPNAGVPEEDPHHLLKYDEEEDPEMEIEEEEPEEEPEPDGVPEAAIRAGSQRSFAIRDFPMGVYETGESSTARDPQFVGG
nr:hypothetical protein [Tanacetum cinerariifolium]